MADIKEISIGNNIYIIKDQHALRRAGDTMTGALNVQMGTPYISMYNYDNVGVRIQPPSTGGSVLEVKDSQGMSLAPINCSQLKVMGVGTQQVIATHVDGTSGYRIWSDGYCVQWGQTLTSSQTITFAKEFASVPNMTWGYVTTRGAASYDGEVFFRSVTAKQFVSGSRLSDGRSPGFMWRAHGFLAQGQY